MNTLQSEKCQNMSYGNLSPQPTFPRDEARVKVLLAPFRQRAVNPENYDSKMKFWRDIIVEYCFFKGKANFCKQELQKIFTQGQRVPSCLDDVLYEMQRLRLVRLRTDYEYDPVNSWTGWAVNRFWMKPVNWSHNKIKKILGSPDCQMGLVEFVHLGVIEKYCNDLQVILDQPPYPGSLHHYEGIKQKLTAALNLSDDSLNLCFQLLYCRLKIGLSYKQDGNQRRMHLVKIPSTSAPNVTITEGDHAIHNLQATKADLLKQLENIEQHITENENKARLYIKDNKRMLAKTYLRKKHLLEKNHEKRSIALLNIETLMSNVDEAKHNGVILDAYRYGTKALQDALKTSNLTYDNVDEVVSDVRETMDNYKELQDTLGNVNFNESVSHDDEDELERELRVLLDNAADLNSSAGMDVGHNNNSVERSISHKVEISDAELLAMLEGLEVEQKTPGKNVSLSETGVDDP